MSVLWVGPACLAGAVAYVYHLNHAGAAANATGGAAKQPLVSTTSFSIMLFTVYALGAVPRSRFFPAWWYRSRPFTALFMYLYSTEAIGYNVLKGLMHQTKPYPHSDFRGGIRTLTEVLLATAGDTKAQLSSAAAAKLGENLQRWRPPCLDDAVGTASTEATRPRPQSAAAVAAAALAKLKKSEEENAAAGTEAVPPLFSLRGGLPVDVQKLQYRKSDRHVLVLPVPICSDNYSYLIFSLRTKKCCLVDGADPIAAMRCVLYLKKHLFGDERSETEIKITDVLTTHKHWDHAGGNKDLCEYATGEENKKKAERNENVCAIALNVYGPSEVPARFANKKVKEGDSFTVCGDAVRVDVLSAPGHTRGSLLFVISDAHAESNNSLDRAAITVKNKLAVFTGDALFSGGLGAPFETDSMEQIKKTRSAFLDSAVLRQHPVTGEPVAAEDVLLYVGHEYTEQLVSEMLSIAKRIIATPSVQADKDHVAHSAGAEAYVANLVKALRDVKILRAQTDGLQDARDDGDDLVDANKASLTTEERERQRKLRHRIPLCTTPTTLALEKRINPLLTVRTEALDAAPLLGGEMDLKEMEKVLYGSLDRVCS